VADASRATEAALARLDGAAPVERALRRALEQRYQSDQVVSNYEFCAWNDAYSTSMRDVYAAFPDDLDVSALFAEAMINRTPWKLWDLMSGEPAEGADTLEHVAFWEFIAIRQESSYFLPRLSSDKIFANNQRGKP
jgi:hypothetical protein